MSPDQKTPPSIVFVVGLSGAGRNTALNVFEDFGFRRMDNIPPHLLMMLLDDPGEKPIAVGFGAFDEGEYRLLGEYLSKASRSDDVGLLFIDARDEILMRRYSATRRRHPHGAGGTLGAGIERERAMLEPLHALATHHIDSSALGPHDLKSRLVAMFHLSLRSKFRVFVQSFSYRHGVPLGVDMLFDCRFLRNPHWDEKLRPRDGREKIIRDYVAKDPNYSRYVEDINVMLDYVVAAAQEEGRSYFTIGFGCSGGRHRSVCLAEEVTRELAKREVIVSLHHRELSHSDQNGG